MTDKIREALQLAHELRQHAKSRHALSRGSRASLVAAANMLESLDTPCDEPVMGGRRFGKDCPHHKEDSMTDKIRDALQNLVHAIGHEGYKLKYEKTVAVKSALSQANAALLTPCGEPAQFHDWNKETPLQKNTWDKQSEPAGKALYITTTPAPEKTTFTMPDGRPIFGENSPHDIGEHLNKLVEPAGKGDVERVARALCIEYQISDGYGADSGKYGDMWKNFIPQAKAAIAAMPHPAALQPARVDDIIDICAMPVEAWAGGYTQKIAAIQTNLEALRPYLHGLNGWQDISTAPRDGTQIIIAAWVNDEWVAMNDDWYQDRVMGDWREWPGIISSEPTHWMPIPKPPPKGE